jgi:hypothetical protein
MSIECARAILRLIALTTILIGVAMTTMTIIGVVAWGQATIAVTDKAWSGGGMDLYAIVAHASIVGWGLVVFVASPRLAQAVAK